MSCLALTTVPPAQQGNFLAFLGSLILVIPPARQMMDNFPFSSAAKAKPKKQTLKSIQVLISETQVQNFVRFSWFDAIAYIVGALLLASGFLVQVFDWHIP